MPNEITIVVKGRDDSGPAMKGPEKELDTLRLRAADAGVDLRRLSEEFQLAGTRGAEYGVRLKEDATFTDYLDQKMANLRGETRRLGEEFQRTGDIDLLGRISSNDRTEGELQNLRSKITDAVDGGSRTGGEKGGEGFAKSFIGGFKDHFQPGLIGTAILAGVTLAPGALLMATGLAGIGVGIIGQLSNPRVHQAFAGMANDLKDTMREATAPFEGQLVKAASSLGGALKDALGSMDFTSLSAMFAELTSGLSGLIENMMPGFNKAIEAAIPILSEFFSYLPEIGDGISQMFDDFSKSGVGAAEGMRIIVREIDGLFRVIGVTVQAGAGLLDFFLRASDAGTELFNNTWGWIPGVHKLADSWREAIDQIRDPHSMILAGRQLDSLGQSATLSADDIGVLTQQLNQASDAASDLAAKVVAKLFGEMMGVDQATLHWHESLTQLADTLGKNGRAIDGHTHLLAENTKAGEENRAAILGAVQANEQQYQAMVAGGISASDAAKAYDANTTALEKQLHAAHYTKDQIDDLIGKYRQVPDKVNTALAVGGLTDAINNLGGLLAQIHNIDGRKFGFYITEHYAVDYQDYRAGERSGKASGGIMGAASGGMRDGLTWVGEYGRELVRLPPGSQVYPHGTSENMAAASGRGGDGASAMAVEFRGDLDSTLAQWFMKAQRDGQVKIYSSAVIANT